MSNLVIDTMSKSDIESILKIEQASFSHPWGRTSFLNELANKFSHNFVLKLENSCQTYQIIAYLCSRNIIDELHILKIAVHPYQRRKRFAVKLLNHCLTGIETQQSKIVTLEVRQSNTAGIGLYKKIGFHVEAQKPNYYSDTREDLILMRKKLF